MCSGALHADGTEPKSPATSFFQLKAHIHGEGHFPIFSKFNPLVVRDTNTAWAETLFLCLQKSIDVCFRKKEKGLVNVFN